MNSTLNRRTIHVKHEIIIIFYVDFSLRNISTLLLVKTWLGFGGVSENFDMSLFIYLVHCIILNCVLCFITESEDTLELFYLKGSVEPNCLLTVKCRSSHHLLQQQSVEFAALRLVGSPHGGSVHKKYLLIHVVQNHLHLKKWSFSPISPHVIVKLWYYGSWSRGWTSANVHTAT